MMYKPPASRRQGGVWVHIRLENGRYYAYASGGPKRWRNSNLALAITFCNRLNNRRKP